MIATDRLVAWAKAEGLTAEEATLRECEQAAVDYVSRITGRNYGLEADSVIEFRWRGGILDLPDTPATDSLVLERWNGTSWEAIAADAYRLSGRLVYLTGAYDVGGTPVRATYTSGYTAGSPDANQWDAPAVVQQAVRMLALHFYVNREAAVVGVVSDEMEWGVRVLLQAVA
jgi:hypothetical protein